MRYRRVGRSRAIGRLFRVVHYVFGRRSRQNWRRLWDRNRDRRPARCCCNSGAVEQCQLGLGEGGRGGTCRFGSAHRHPEYLHAVIEARAMQLANRSALVRRISSIRRPPFSVLKQGFDTRPSRTPFQFVDSLLERGHLEVDNQLPEQQRQLILSY